MRTSHRFIGTVSTNILDQQTPILTTISGILESNRSYHPPPNPSLPPVGEKASPGVKMASKIDRSMSSGHSSGGSVTPNGPRTSSFGLVTITKSSWFSGIIRGAYKVTPAAWFAGVQTSGSPGSGINNPMCFHPVSASNASNAQDSIVSSACRRSALRDKNSARWRLAHARSSFLSASMSGVGTSHPSVSASSLHRWLLLHPGLASHQKSDAHCHTKCGGVRHP